MDRWSRISSVAVNVALVAILGYVLTLPGSFIRRWVEVLRERHAISTAWYRLETESSTVQSREHPRLIIFEFGDYQCPFCSKQEELMPELIQNYPDVEWHFLELPLPIHRYAEPAARAALCADEQGRFREMHDLLFSVLHATSDAVDWAALAKRAGVTNLLGFDECLHHDRTTAHLARVRMLVDELGLRGTPSFVYRSGLHAGVLTDSMIVTLLKASTSTSM
jgi:protein-disulfide isomerase